MAKKKIFLLPLIVTLMLLFVVSMITSACSCGVQGGIGNETPVIVDLTVSPVTITTGSQGTVSVNVAGYEGNISELDYEWSIDGGTIGSSNGNTMAFIASDNPGIITIGVTISDQSVVVATGSIQVTVEEAANANADDESGLDEEVIATLTVSPVTITTGSQGTVSVNVAGYEGNISELDYEWSIDGGTIGSSNGNTMAFIASGNPGIITIGVTISDQSGVVVAEGSIQVTVEQSAQQQQGATQAKPAEGVTASDIQEN